jgi:hypothetical protein
VSASGPSPQLDAAKGEQPPATALAPADPESPPLELPPREAALMRELDRLVAGGAADPNVLKPVQALAALVRLLLRKRIVSAKELLDELSRR